MKSVLYITNYPSPYRVDFFNLLGKQVGLTVSFTSAPEDQTHRSTDWFHKNYENFNAVFLKKAKRICRQKVFIDIIPLIRKGYDHIICGGYSSPTYMLAIEYMKFHNIPFCMEADGGLVRDDPWYKTAFKKHFISPACCWFSSGRSTTDYFIHYGANKDRIIEYPFTSMSETDLQRARQRISGNRSLWKERLQISEEKVITTVGQFIHRKGFDVLIRAAKHLPCNTGIYIIGGEPDDEYILLKQNLALDNVHFVGFKNKEELEKYYCASDLFVLPAREDIWGLVINEAMAYGLPVVATDRCGAALSLLEDGVNGYIVPVEDAETLADRIRRLLSDDAARESMGQRNLSVIEKYSIENMVKAHMDFFNSRV